MAANTQITLTRPTGEVIEMITEPTFGIVTIGVFTNQAQYDDTALNGTMPPQSVSLSNEETSTLRKLLQ